MRKLYIIIMFDKYFLCYKIITNFISFDFLESNGI